jgi:hypothetical protein
MQTSLVPIGIFITGLGLLGELLIGGFRGFFDWAYIKTVSEPHKLVMTRCTLGCGVVLLVVGGLVEVAAAIA